MRVCVVPSDKGGCGFYRLRWPAQALRDQGHKDIVLSDTDDAKDIIATEFDVIVFQRPARTLMLAHIQKLQSAGVAVVVDMDDDFSCIPANNKAHHAFHPKHSPGSNWDNIAKACQIADLVTVSTGALAKRYGSHGRVRALPNYVPSWYLDMKGKKNHVTFGWSGAIETHPDDLQVTRGAVNRAMRSSGAGFRSIGVGTGVADGLDLDAEPPSTGWLDIEGDYQGAMASLSVGIVPLADHQFNRAKSWLKGLEYASLGVPFVASPLPEYRELNRLGIGILAPKPKDWERELKLMALSPGYRRNEASKNRDAAADLTIEKHAWRWYEAWQDAMLNHTARRVA